MSIRESPHYRLPATELATWVDRQGPDRWWSIDGDLLLTSRIFIPVPGDDLALELRKIPKMLLLADKDGRPEAQGQTIGADDLDRLVDLFPYTNDRVLFLSWQGTDIDWLLIEDEETSASEARERQKELAQHGRTEA